MKNINIAVLLFFALIAIPVSPARAQFYVFADGDMTGEPAPELTTECVRMENSGLWGSKATWTEQDMAQYRDGSMAIVYFWATWCPNCGDYLKNLNDSQAKFAEESIKIMPVNIVDPKKQVENYLKKHNIGMDIFLDAKGELESAYQVYGVPTFYFISSNGKITAVRHRLPDDYHTLLKDQSTTDQ